MTNNKFFSFILFGVFLILAIGCSTVSYAGGQNETAPVSSKSTEKNQNKEIQETNHQSHLITVLGVPAGYRATLRVRITGVRDIATSATVFLDSNEQNITFSFIDTDGKEPDYNNPITWTGSGEYAVWIDFWKTDSNNSKVGYRYGGPDGLVSFTNGIASENILDFSQFVNVN